VDGFPLAISKTLLSDLIRDLRPVYLFNVGLFAGASTTLSPRSLEANDIKFGLALDIIDGQTGGGGTELAAALDTALAILPTEGVARSVVVVTDGFVSAEFRCFTTIVRALENASVFAFRIGSSVNRYLIEGLARAGQGEAFVVTEPKQARSVSERFREYISAPVLTNIRIVADGWYVYDLEPTVIADMLAQRPVLVTGKWRGERAGSISSIRTGRQRVRARTTARQGWALQAAPTRHSAGSC
jgi:Ca-activated chloride channel family protein